MRRASPWLGLIETLNQLELHSNDSARPLHLQIAAALQAEKLILMTDVPGVMKDKDDISSLYRALDIRGCKDLMKEGIIYGGMTPKVRMRLRSMYVVLVLPNDEAPCIPLSFLGFKDLRMIGMKLPMATLNTPLLCVSRVSPQVSCCIRSLAQGVSATHIVDGRQPHSLLQELLTDEGVGTMITG